MRSIVAKEFVKHVTMLTQTNQHTEARLVVALAAKGHVHNEARADRLLEAYAMIETEQSTKGHLSQAMQNTRYILDSELRDLISWAWENWHEIWGAL